MKKVILVVAGDYRQYINYLRENNLTQSEAKYIDYWQKAAGFLAEKVVTVGTWYKNNDASELVKFCETRVC